MEVCGKLSPKSSAVVRPNFTKILIDIAWAKFHMGPPWVGGTAAVFDPMWLNLKPILRLYSQPTLKEY